MSYWTPLSKLTPATPTIRQKLDNQITDKKDDSAEYRLRIPSEVTFFQPELLLQENIAQDSKVAIARYVKALRTSYIYTSINESEEKYCWYTATVSNFHKFMINLQETGFTDIDGF